MCKQTACPKCGKQEWKKGMILAAAAIVQMVPQNNKRSKSSPISALYCGNCGFIMESYVEHPEKLED